PPAASVPPSTVNTTVDSAGRPWAATIWVGTVVTSSTSMMRGLVRRTKPPMRWRSVGASTTVDMSVPDDTTGMVHRQIVVETSAHAGAPGPGDRPVPAPSEPRRLRLTGPAHAAGPRTARTRGSLGRLGA